MNTPTDADALRKHLPVFGRRTFVAGAVTTAAAMIVGSVSDMNTASAADTTTAGSTLARQLWTEVYCMCGDCDHMPLAVCKCEDSERVRTEIAAQLERLGYATPSATQKARAAVLQEYVKRFGDGALVMNDPPTRSAVLHGVGAATIVVATICGLIFLTERMRRRLAPNRVSTKRKRRKR